MNRDQVSDSLDLGLGNLAEQAQRIGEGLTAYTDNHRHTVAGALESVADALSDHREGEWDGTNVAAALVQVAEAIERLAVAAERMVSPTA